MELQHSKALIVGMGRSGFETASFLTQRGARVTISDTAGEDEMGEAAHKFRELGVQIEFGGHVMDTFANADYIVISPGVPHTIPPIQAAQEKGIPLIGEIELACRFIKEPIIAVTGTNGKTTTTRLIGDMLEQSGQTIFVGGNIGNPLTSYLTGHEKAHRLVVEVSSFQLDTITSFRPDISLLLNITDDHLDRYSGVESYAKAKGRILENQKKNDIAVLNGADRRIRQICSACEPEKVFFTGRQEKEKGADIGTHSITLHGLDRLHEKESRMSGSGQHLYENQAAIEMDRVPLKCRHELENISAAVLATLVAGGTLNGIQKALETFKGLPHRMEHVAVLDGVVFYNDSKATNVDAVLRAIECLQGPIHLIMGGQDKGGRFHLLEPSVRQKVKNLILLGEASGDIEAALGNLTATRIVATMEDAVSFAHATASPGEVVLLSPGCASFDMYQDYKERGDVFRKTVCKHKT
ncbi:MAG: UDP-N-acetylmuramoyl-L-alanine--D-glutamate ligase [Desulfobacterales bacterium]|nr:UDP-N-acetylmuramoyl-L-alanine--D-glutamate ligase [Desulfobacterales bacterium]MDX2513292.1 UDP-N-acetylmuramoyl-L-alanine--D-glutamate ligase [Desulfobacterales bacterium]